MTNSMLALKRLHVRRMPGITEPYTITDLVPGVNILYGPNGSGKTVTTQAIAVAFWPREASCDPPPSVEADIADGETMLHVQVDAGFLSAQRNGHPCDPPVFPVADKRQRYHLALHELLQASDGDFARAIMVESAGGVDVTGAAKELGFKEVRPTSQKGQDLRVARQALREIQSGQEMLLRESETLGVLEQRAREATAAVERAQVLKLAIQHAEAMALLENAQARVDDFPGILTSVTGDEPAQLRALEQEIAQRTADARQAAEAMQCADAIVQTALPELSADRGFLPRLRAELDTLATCDAELRHAIQRHAEAKGEVERARRILGESVTGEQLDAIDDAGFNALTTFARSLEEVQSQQSALRAEIERLTPPPTSPSTMPHVSLSQLREGGMSLSRWLQSAGTDPESHTSNRFDVIVIWSLVLIGAAGGLLLALQGHVAWVSLGVIAVVLATVWQLRRPAESSGARDGVQRQYLQLRLLPPERWTVEGVLALFQKFQEAIAVAELEEQRHGLRADAERRLKDVDARAQHLEVQRGVLTVRYGVAPDTDARKLVWIAGALIEQQRGAVKLAGAQATLNSMQQQRHDLLTRITQSLAPLGLRPTSTEEVRGVVAVLEDKVTTFEQASRDLETESREHARATTRLLDLTAERSGIYERIMLAPGDDTALQQLVAQCHAYTTAVEDLHEAQVQLRVHRENLERSVGATATLTTLLGESLAALREQRQTAESCAGERDMLVNRIAQIRANTNAAAEGRTLERALAAKLEAEQALHEYKLADVATVVGNAVVRFVQAATRDAHRPRVFHRAATLFAEVTRGRYRLDLQEGDAPEFRAIDTETGIGYALGQLSSATKIQLLLAVRVAFVESCEQGVALPLLLDETLATSDPHRTAAIMDMTATLARDGRQIFYCTAQPEEVGKWMDAMHERQVPIQLFDLEAIRQKREEKSSERIVPRLAPVVPLPAPGPYSHEEYGRLLRVPVIHPGEDVVGKTPLWYLFDDPHTLHHLYSSGIDSWGPLETMVTHGGGTLIPDGERVLPKAVALAKAMHGLHEAYAIGRGKVVDRAVLYASGAVSDSFMDSVTNILAEEHGDGARLVAALRDGGRIKRFQKDKVNELEAYLKEAGYIDERAPLSESEIRARLLSSVALELTSGIVTAADLDALLGRLRQVTEWDGMPML